MTVATPREETPREDMGLAIFVKTPGHSALKTRLAGAIGRAAAEEFHVLAASAVAAVAQAAQARLRPPATLTAYWAVAEPDAIDAPAWATLPRLAQGKGHLGVRMGHVTSALLAAQDGALLLGADAPQLCVEDVLAAVQALAHHDDVIGPSADGGFWLYATRQPPPSRAWTDTPWSRADTAGRFISALAPRTLATLRTLRDVDTGDDLAPLLAALDALPAPLESQRRLARWLRARLAAQP